MACYDLYFEAIMQNKELASLIIEYHELRNKLHERSSEIPYILKEMQEIVAEQLSSFHD